MAAVLAALAVTVGATACGTAGRVESGSAARGKPLFQQQCGSCHKLADAGTQGTIGPDLDAAFATLRSDAPGQGFRESTIRDVVRGQIAYPVVDPPTDAPGMPANLVTGEDADAVAAYVASVAGLPPKEGAQAAGTGEPATNDPKALFTDPSLGCGGCHTFSKAGTEATVGPSLDQSTTTLEEAITQIRKGGGGMPAFEGRLNDEQIRALAEYVTGK